MTANNFSRRAKVPDITLHAYFLKFMFSYSILSSKFRAGGLNTHRRSYLKVLRRSWGRWNNASLAITLAADYPLKTLNSMNFMKTLIKKTSSAWNSLPYPLKSFAVIEHLVRLSDYPLKEWIFWLNKYTHTFHIPADFLELFKTHIGYTFNEKSPNVTSPWRILPMFEEYCSDDSNNPAKGSFVKHFELHFIIEQSLINCIYIQTTVCIHESAPQGFQ